MTRHVHRSGRLWFGLVVIVLALSVTLWIGCSEQFQTPSEPEETQDLVLLDASHPQVQKAMLVQDRITDLLINAPNILGTGTGLTEDGNPAIVVFAKAPIAFRADASLQRLSKNVAVAELPQMIEEVPVVVQVTDEFKAIKGPPPGKDNGDDVDHTVRFDRPVPLGTSTGHPAITAGTLGARLTDGTNVFALSNNHVYAATNSANINDAVIQPGTFDGGSSPDDDIGTLSAFVPIDFVNGGNVVDAAIAITTTADVGNTTTSDCYGTPKSETVAAALNMQVQKCGRTTEQSKGTIQAINATVNVNYGSPGVAQFVNQIITTNMSAGGDSGSLAVAVGKGKNKNDDRKPVGLLYAGSSSLTVFNPIGAVLASFGMTIDGE
jgi:hypothetical protein